ncbi:MAG: helix-turn-helix domain-containing protein [Pseudomonadota bacterium]
MALSIEQAAQGFAAAGSEPRLEVLLSLVRAGPTGLSVGEIQERTGMPASTLAHHLRFLAAGGLIEQEKNGRAVINRAAFEHIETLAAFLLSECCVDAKAGITPKSLGLNEKAVQ